MIFKMNGIHSLEKNLWRSNIILDRHKQLSFYFVTFFNEMYYKILTKYDFLYDAIIYTSTSPFLVFYWLCSFFFCCLKYIFCILYAVT